MSLHAACALLLYGYGIDFVGRTSNSMCNNMSLLRVHAREVCSSYSPVNDSLHLNHELWTLGFCVGSRDYFVRSAKRSSQIISFKLWLRRSDNSFVQKTTITNCKMRRISSLETSGSNVSPFLRISIITYIHETIVHRSMSLYSATTEKLHTMGAVIGVQHRRHRIKPHISTSTMGIGPNIVHFYCATFLFSS